MTRRYRVTHRTEYRYGQPVVGHTIARVVPRDLPQQRVVAAEVDVSPSPTRTSRHRDGLGNVVTYMRLKGVVPPSSEPPFGTYVPP